MKISRFLKITFFASLACFASEVLNSQRVYAQTVVRAPQWGGLCLDIANPEGKGPQNGAPVLAFQCHGGGNQIFQVSNDGTIRAPRWGGLCLDIANPEGKGPQNGVPVLAFQCHGGGNQKWSFGGSTAPSAVSFPITGERDDAVSSGRMRTSFTLNSNGQLTAVTNTRTKVKLKGFTGGVSIVLLNANRQPIWASSAHRYGVDGCVIGRCNRNDNWSDSVPPDILRQVRGYAILQQHDPKWLSLAGQRGEQFLRWLNSDEGKATISTIVTIAAML